MQMIIPQSKPMTFYALSTVQEYFERVLHFVKNCLKSLTDSKMDEDEKQKVKRLIQEKRKVDGQKLEWMYKEDKPDDEDYLLGKRIDKVMEKQENSKEGAKRPIISTERSNLDDVGALFNERIQANIAMDMQTKMREDPLFAIRKKEEEAKRRLLQNPVKMKRLQQMIDQKKKESKEHKKAKKKHKNRDSNSDSDDDIMAKYLNIINRKQKSGNDGRQKSQSERQRDRSPSLMEKQDKQQSRTGDRSKQHESDSHDEDYQRKEKNYRDREKKEGRNEDWRNRERRRDLESDNERHKQHRDMDTGRMQRYSNLDFDYHENFHGNKKVGSSRRRDSDSDSDSHSRNSDTSKQRKKDWSEPERAGYHRNKEKDQIRKQNYSDSEDDNYSSNRKDKRSDKHRHSDIDEESKEKKFDKKNFGLEYRGSSKDTGRKQRHSDSEDDHHGKKQRHSYSEDDHHGKKQRHSDSEDDHHGKQQRHSDSEDDHHSNKKVKTERPKSSSKSEDDRKSNDGQQKNKTCGYGLVMPRGVSPVRKFEKTSSSDRSRTSKMSGSRSPKGRKSRSPSPKRMKPSPKQSKTRSPENKRSSSGRRVLSEEERKRRLEEMMDNAKWREDQRKQNVTRYREDEKREEEDQKKDFDSSHFLKPMISGHVEKSSVEDRLKRNKYNILRTNADLDRGFSKK